MPSIEDIGKFIGNVGSGGILSVVQDVLDRVIKDPVQLADAKLRAATLQQNGELAAMKSVQELAQGQMDINKVEATSPKSFVAGWRPFIGWICGVGLAMDVIVGPIFTWLSIWISTGHPGAFPALDTSTLMPLLFGMLGLGGLRTYEKINAAQGNH